MRKTLTLAILAVFTLISNAQKNKRTAFNLQAFNVVYVGIHNPIIVYDFTKGDTIIAPKGATITPFFRYRNNEFVIKANKPTAKNSYLKFTVKDNKGKTKSTFSLRAKRLPDPKAYALSKSGNSYLFKDQLKSLNKLDAKLDIAMDISVKVSSYFITINANGKTEQYKVKGAKIPEDIQKKLKSLPKDSQVVFESIKVRYPDGSTRKPTSIVLKIK